MKLEELDLSTKSVKIGALNVLQALSGASIEDIKTAISSTLGSTQHLSGELKIFISKLLDDGMISPDEKKQLRRELGIIQTEFPMIRLEAVTAGVPEFSSGMTDYEASYTSLYSYLYVDLKVFDDMASFTVVANRIEFEEKWKVYYSTRDALKKAVTDGLLLQVLESVGEEIDAANVRIDNVRLGDIIDGAIKRASLESDVQHEIFKVSSSLFPNGLDRQGTIDFLTPRVAISEDIVEYLLSLVGEQEEMVELRANEIRIISTKSDEVSSRMASIEMNFDSITQIVAEIAPLPDGQIANLTQIAQTAASLDLLVTTGRYDSGTGEIDSFSLAQMKLLSDRITLFVGGSGSDFDAASWVVKQDQIAGVVQNAIESDGELIANIAQMVQGAESVQFQVSQLRSETIERIDDALITAQAGILINATEITLGVQNLEEQLQSLLTVQADRISALVQDVAKSSASILSIKSDQIDAMVKGGGAQAYLSLSVTLPTTIDADARNVMIRALGAEPVNAVYVLTSGGFWYVSPDSTIVAQKTLKNGLRAAGLLGSQITLDADEILMGGKVKAKNIDVEDLNALGTITVGMSRVTGLTEISDGKIKTNLINTDELVTKRLAIDSNPNSSTDFEVNINETNGIIIRKNGDVLFSVLPSGNATLRDAVMQNVSMQNAEMADVSISGNSLFIGDIDSGPLLLSSSQAAGDYHSYGSATTIYDLWVALCALYPENYTEIPATTISTGFYGINKMAIIGSFGNHADARYIQIGKGIHLGKASYSIRIYFSDGTSYYDLTGYLSTSKQIGSALYFAKGSFGKTLKLRDMPAASGIKDVVYVDVNGFLKLSK